MIRKLFDRIKNWITEKYLYRQITRRLALEGLTSEEVETLRNGVEALFTETHKLSFVHGNKKYTFDNIKSQTVQVCIASMEDEDIITLIDGGNVLLPDLVEVLSYSTPIMLTDDQVNDAIAGLGQMENVAYLQKIYGVNWKEHYQG